MDEDKELSFDPRSWSEPGQQAATPAPSAPPARRAMGNGLRVSLAALLSIALVGGGTTIAWLTREPDVQVQEASLPEPESELYGTSSQRIVNLPSLDGLLGSLIANGIAPEEAAAATQAALSVLAANSGEVRAVIAIDGETAPYRLAQLTVSFMDSSGAIVAPAADGSFSARPVAASLDTQFIDVHGEMNDTDFYSSAVTAGVTDSLISTFAQAFVFDFNFQTEIQAGDLFEAAFEQKVNQAGEPVGPPRLLFAAMTTDAKSRAVYRFKPPDEEEGWFDGNGRSVKRSFMRTPVDGARITSRFGMRFHPILHFNRMHGGTDFAAPIGTPIYATGPGQIEWAAMKGCNGNLVVLRHDNGWETYYLHMLHFTDGIAAGTRVRQGQEIGVVGTTGCSTGPHLHYEVHIDGERVDPESIPTEQGEILKGDVLKAFIKHRDRIDVARARYAG